MGVIHSGSAQGSRRCARHASPVEWPVVQGPGAVRRHRSQKRDRNPMSTSHDHDAHDHHDHHDRPEVHAPGHARGHGHNHAHPHASTNFNRAFAIGIVLNLAFVGIEAGYGWHVNSLALLADAGHNLSDVIGLVLAWGAAWAGRLQPDARYTYGWKRASILAAVVNALMLLVAMGSLAWEAVLRLQAPQAVQGITIMVVAGIGIVVNTATALLFMRGSDTDLNLRGAFLHMAADALVSAGVVVAGALALWLGWTWLDPVVSLAIAAVIVAGSWGLFKQSVHLLFDGVPESVDLHAVQALLEALPGVERAHDLHVWAMGTSQVAMTAHLVMPESPADDAFLQEATRQLHEHFGIEHVTLQVMRVPFTRPCNALTPVAR